MNDEDDSVFQFIRFHHYKNISYFYLHKISCLSMAKYVLLELMYKLRERKSYNTEKSCTEIMHNFGLQDRGLSNLQTFRLTEVLYSTRYILSISSFIRSYSMSVSSKGLCLVIQNYA